MGLQIKELVQVFDLRRKEIHKQIELTHSFDQFRKSNSIVIIIRLKILWELSSKNEIQNSFK